MMMIRKTLVLLITCSITHSCSTQIHDGVTMVPMRDGIELSTLLVFPKVKQEKYPVILIRTPYKKELGVEKYSYLLENGYTLALQDIRGRFGSEGIYEPFIKDGEDGYDTIEWIASQSWCDGNVGMIGLSYDGWLAYCAATEKPPHLKTIIVNCSPVDPFYDFPYRYGVFIPASLSLFEIIESEATADPSGKKIQEINSKDWLKLLDHQPVSELDTKILSRKLDYYQKWIQHNSRDDYWKQTCSLEKLKEIRIPVFIQSGWLDTQLRNSKLAYNELIRTGNPKVKIIIGPWSHSDMASKYSEGKFLGEAADDINLQFQYIRWFDYWLKNKNNGIINEPMVQLYSMKSNRWYSDNTYPLKNTTDKILYLNSTKKADLIINGGELTFNTDKIGENADKYIYDPSDVLVYSKDMQGRYDIFQKKLSKRDDYLFYKSESFNEKTTILGQISARIYASSSALDTDWYAILLLLDNKANFLEGLTFGLLRAKFRNSFEKPELLERDKIYQFDLDMNHYGITIEKGQKLGLIITSSSGYPGIAKNLNTGKNSQTETDFEIASQKIYHTRDYKSYISIPILNDDNK
jgi:putative CocE/NonD family hydrolase